MTDSLKNRVAQYVQHFYAIQTLERKITRHQSDMDLLLPSPYRTAVDATNYTFMQHCILLNPGKRWSTHWLFYAAQSPLPAVYMWDKVSYKNKLYTYIRKALATKFLLPTDVRGEYRLNPVYKPLTAVVKKRS